MTVIHVIIMIDLVTRNVMDNSLLYLSMTTQQWIQ